MAKSIFKQFGTNTDLERNGRWITFYDEETEIRFLVARAGGANEAYQRNLLLATKPFRKGSVDMEDLPPATQKKILIEVYAKTIVKDWENVYFEDGGAPVQFSEDAAKTLFTNAPQLFEFIANEANNFRNYMETKRSEDAKNS